MHLCWVEMMEEKEQYLVSIVVLAYNEEHNLSTQVEACAEWFRRLEDHPEGVWPEVFDSFAETHAVGEVLIVDDGSTDGTSRVAGELSAAYPFVRVIRHHTNLGMGAAVRSGYGAARGRYVTQLPADCQILPTTLERLLPELEKADLVLSVYKERGDGVKRALMSRGFQFLVRALYGHEPKYTGTMILRSSLLSDHPIRSRTFFANLELPFRLIDSQVAFRVVQIEALPRRSGASKVANPMRIIEVVSEMIHIRLGDWR